MTLSIIVSNSSPLIGLDQIEQLHLLEALVGTIIVPPAVVREVSPGLTFLDWVKQQVLVQAIGPVILSTSLGAGESEAISYKQVLHDAGEGV